MQTTPETQWFDGRLWKRSLPVLRGAPGPEAPALKRMLLPQGELAQVHDSDDAIRYIAVIELREGTTRGNHVHRIKREFIYLLHGECTLLVEDIASKIRETVPLALGDLVFIAPGLAHVLCVTRSGEAIECSPDRFDPADTVRYPLHP